MSRRTHRRLQRRGKCRHCGRIYVLAKAGRLSRHSDGQGRLCAGSGQAPGEWGPG